jgi:hypothetical protein
MQRGIGIRECWHIENPRLLEGILFLKVWQPSGAAVSLRLIRSAVKRSSPMAVNTPSFTAACNTAVFQ